MAIKLAPQETMNYISILSIDATSYPIVIREKSRYSLHLQFKDSKNKKTEESTILSWKSDFLDPYDNHVRTNGKISFTD